MRALRADEVEVRVSRCSAKGAALLLYKTSRTDMAMLDEVYGPERWQCRYEVVKGVLNCSIGVYVNITGHKDETYMGNEWVWKQAAGTPSNTEAEKGESSDALKRAGFLWGIGRELYTAPFIWVPAEKLQKLQERNGKWQCFDRFEVKQLDTVDGRIVALVIGHEGKTDVVYGYGTRKDPKPPVADMGTGKKADAFCSPEQAEDVQKLAEEFGTMRGKPYEEVLDALAATKAMQRTGYTAGQPMTGSQAGLAIAVLTSWISKAR